MFQVDPVNANVHDKRKKVSGAGAKESKLEEGEIEEFITDAENVPLVINKKKPSKDNSTDDKVTNKPSKEWKGSDAALILLDLAGGKAAAGKEEIVFQKETRKSDTLIDSAAAKNQPEKNVPVHATPNALGEKVINKPNSIIDSSKNTLTLKKIN